MSEEQSPKTLQSSLTPSGTNAANAGGAFLGWALMKYLDVRYGIKSDYNEAATIVGGCSIVAGFLHQFFGLLIDKLR